MLPRCKSPPERRTPPPLLCVQGLAQNDIRRVRTNSRHARLPVDDTADFGYNIARMDYEIVFAPEAIEDWRSLTANWRATVRDAIERHLRHTPTKASKSRIKRLRGVSRPHYRLRVDDIRVFYDVSEETVEISSSPGTANRLACSSDSNQRMIGLITDWNTTHVF